MKEFPKAGIMRILDENIFLFLKNIITSRFSNSTLYILEVAVFTAGVNMSGTFVKPNVSAV